MEPLWGAGEPLIPIVLTQQRLELRREVTVGAVAMCSYLFDKLGSFSPDSPCRFSRMAGRSNSPTPPEILHGGALLATHVVARVLTSAFERRVGAHTTYDSPETSACGLISIFELALS